MASQRLLPIAILLLSIVLTGAEKVNPDRITGSSGGGAFSCHGIRGGCSGPVEIGGGIDEGVSKSTTYAMPRAEISSSFTGNFQSSSFRATSTLGAYLSQGVTLSDDYKTFHPLSRDVLTISPSVEDEIFFLTGKSP